MLTIPPRRQVRSMPAAQKKAPFTEATKKTADALPPAVKDIVQLAC